MAPTRRRGTTVVVAVACFGAISARAAQWSIDPRFRVGEIFTDNVALDESGGTSDYISELTPGISIHGAGARLKLDLDYNLQNYLYARDSERNATNHQLQSQATAELLEEILFVDARGQMSQQLIDSTGRFSESTSSINSNVTDATIYEFSPWGRHHFGGYADAQVRYRYSEVEYGEQLLTNASTTHGFNASITGGRVFDRVPWTVTFNREDSSFQRGQSVELNDLNARLAYVLTRRFRVTGTVGYEDNTYRSNRSSTQGEYWSLGGAWTPTPRTQVQAEIGDRFFGRTVTVSARAGHKRWNFSANYDEAADSSSRVQRQRQLIPLVDENGLPILDPEDPVLFPIDPSLPSLTDDVFIRRSLRVSAGFTGRRDQMTFGFQREVRQFEARDEEETALAANASWSHQLSARLGLRASGTYRAIKFQQLNRDDDYISASVATTYRLGRHVNGVLEYRYRDANSDAEANRYSENSLSAYLNLFL